RTDDALEHVGKLRSLRILDLANTKVSADGLSHLKGLVKLEHLTLTGTQVNKSAVEKIQSALPKCRIVR
ncbi:MAG TPA: hypothetical protein VGX78_04380, partial [Pirellulales bacterium]|nr:hypothetical protein [Pirellulales bacterium]